MARPLEGVKVLDFSHGVAGPYCSMILGDLGCEVIKIEMPRRGDASRYMNVSNKFNDDIPNSGGDYYLAINRNKKAITINLKTDEGKKVIYDLVKYSDVVIQNFRPGVMKRLGLDYDSLKKHNKDIVYANLTAYGNEGPIAHQPGMDVAVQARSGVMSITGYEGSEPVKPGVSLADFAGGVHLSVGLISALYYKEKHGDGQEVNVSLLDSTMSMLSNYSVAVMDGEAKIKKMGSGHPQLVPFQAFTTSDGHIVIATGTNKLYKEFCTLLKLEELLDDPRFKKNPDRVKNREILVEIISEKTRQNTTEEWVELFEKNSIPCAPVNTMEQALSDAQLRSNEMIQTLDHPVYGEIHVLGTPYKFSQSKCDEFNTPPLLGQHTEEILKSTLQYSEENIAALKKKGVI
jgi:crotonobetainyl-CoA:carnitine CoA-transferase CaiB-like acyl-CoA transferase